MARVLQAFLLLLPLSAVAAAAGPAKPIDVFLIGGQSNATGQGYMANLAPGVAPDAHVMLFHSGKPHLNSGAEANTWMPLRQASESPDRFGPELGFGNRLQERMPGRPIALIKHAHSGSSLVADWPRARTRPTPSTSARSSRSSSRRSMPGLKGCASRGLSRRFEA